MLASAGESVVTVGTAKHVPVLSESKATHICLETTREQRVAFLWMKMFGDPQGPLRFELD